MKTFVDINNSNEKQFGLQFIAKNDWDALILLMNHHAFEQTESINQPKLEEYYTSLGEYNTVDNLIMN